MKCGGKIMNDEIYGITKNARIEDIGIWEDLIGPFNSISEFHNFKIKWPEFAEIRKSDIIKYFGQKFLMTKKKTHNII